MRVYLMTALNRGKYYAVAVVASIQQLPAAYGDSIQCVAERKFGFAGEVPKEQLDIYEPSNRLIVVGESIAVQRCSYSPSKQRHTCDTYEVDRVETDRYTGIRKYYYFSGQFDLQIYPDQSFVENNGRGLVSFGHCVEE